MPRLHLQAVLPTAAAIGVAHIIVGICILIDPHALLVTAFAGLKWVATVFSFGDKIGGVILLTVGWMALIGGAGLFGVETPTRIRLIAPQLVVLVFTLASLAVALITGHYPDGYAPNGGWVFILADQVVAGTVSVFHIWSVFTLPLRERAHGYV